MKKLQLGFVTILCFFVSCRQEKIVTKTQEPIFKSNTQPGHVVQPSFVADNSNSPEARMDMLKEMQENQLPMSSPQVKYPTWQSYNELYQTKIMNLSPLTKQYCSQLFLASYNIPQQQSTPELNAVVKTHADYLVSQKYKGYKLLYETMVWLKNNKNDDFVNSEKEKISIYAEPSLHAPNSKLEDSQEVLQNEQLRKELDNMILAMKENDSYIQKIKEL